jgi:hypothetical protein
VYSLQEVKGALTDIGRLLLFREVRPDLKRKGPLFLALGLGFAWLAGIGRYWDNPRATFLQHLGIGSVLYCFILALLLWLIIWPLRPSNWNYWNVLIFVSLTSPPALLYAIPVEKFMSIDAAIQINILLLAIVAIWRMSLLFVYLRRSGGLGVVETVVAALIPVDLVIVALTVLNLNHVVFEIMGGVRDADRSPHDGAYTILFLITVLSFYASPFLLFTYISVAIQRYNERKDRLISQASSDKEPSSKEPSSEPPPEIAEPTEPER